MSDDAHTPHLVGTERMQRISDRMESYLHLSKRMILNQFGTDGGVDHVLVTVTLAAAMANLETAEIIADGQDNIAEIVKKGEA